MSDVGPDVMLGIDVDQLEGEDPPVGIFQITEEGPDSFGVRLIGKGDDVPDALRETADRLDDGEDYLEGLDG